MLARKARQGSRQRDVIMHPHIGGKSDLLFLRQLGWPMARRELAKVCGRRIRAL